MVVRKLIKQKPRRGKFSGKNFKKREILINAEEQARLEAKSLGLRYTPPAGGKKKKKKPKCSRWLFPGAHYPGKPAPPRKNARENDTESSDDDVDAPDMDKGMFERKGPGKLRYFEQMVGQERTQGGELDSVTFSRVKDRAKEREKEEKRETKRKEKEEKREKKRQGKETEETEAKGERVRREKEERRAEKRAKRESQNGAACGNAGLSGACNGPSNNAATRSTGANATTSGSKAIEASNASKAIEASNAAADSSSEDEEEAKRRAAISSVVVEGSHIMGAAATATPFRHKRKAKRGLHSTLASKERRRLRKMGIQPDGEEEGSGSEDEDEGEDEGGEDGEGKGGGEKSKDLKLKHYQIRAQDMLHQHLDRLLEMTVSAAKKGYGEGAGGERGKGGGMKQAGNTRSADSDSTEGHDTGITGTKKEKKDNTGKKSKGSKSQGKEGKEKEGQEDKEGKKRKKGMNKEAKQVKAQPPVEVSGIALFRKGPVVSLS
ncbi:hypothetical protein CLOP_g5631 [Closterium sp. NIES-67]|nr:hypothetical protein CLOP_g5631 [Closterium sp. NIES-67]